MRNGNVYEDAVAKRGDGLRNHQQRDRQYHEENLDAIAVGEHQSQLEQLSAANDSSVERRSQQRTRTAGDENIITASETQEFVRKLETILAKRNPGGGGN